MTCQLSIVATPGAYLRIGRDDEAGDIYYVPDDGITYCGTVPRVCYSVVQFRLTPWGSWDSGYGCPRQTFDATNTCYLQGFMPPLEDYSAVTDKLCGRVYRDMAHPAGGIDIVAIDFEATRLISTVAKTDANGWWEVSLPATGLGGDLWVHDPTWGTVPVLGAPYSDIVLGARLGGAGIAVPKYAYVEDIPHLLNSGPQVSYYVAGEETITLGSQPFEEGESLPGQYRATYTAANP